MSVEVIAEIGSCHDGSLDKALALVHAAKDCGANVAKAQFWSSARRMSERRHAPDYEAIYRQYQVPEAWLPVLAAEAKRVGLTFACSSYLPEDVDTVARHAEILKISSFEANDRALLMAHVPYCGSKRIIVSMGLRASTQSQSALASHIERLHCVTAYPAPLGSLALGWLCEGYDGYSPGSSKRTYGWTKRTTRTPTQAHTPCVPSPSMPISARSATWSRLCVATRPRPKPQWHGMRCAECPCIGWSTSSRARRSRSR
jgi:hypothetical protein